MIQGRDLDQTDLFFVGIKTIGFGVHRKLGLCLQYGNEIKKLTSFLDDDGRRHLRCFHGAYYTQHGSLLDGIKVDST